MREAKPHETVRIVDRTFLFGRTTGSVIYEVDTDLAGTVFMRVDESASGDDSRWVVIVDAARFLAAWRATPGERSDIARLSPDGWRKDYKFAGAEKGFRHGRPDPVPLALPSAWLQPEGGPPWVDLTNGITRTIWLLAAGAKAFPVECRGASANLLTELAGVPEIPPATVGDLLDGLSWETWMEEQRGERSDRFSP